MIDDDLIGAARNNDVIALKKLLEKGADVEAADVYGWTALMKAMFKEKSRYFEPAG